MRKWLFFVYLSASAYEYDMHSHYQLRSSGFEGEASVCLDGIVEKALMSACCVATGSPEGIWDGLWQSWYGYSFGTGFFISPQGHFLTAKHVIENNYNTSLYLALNNHLVKATCLAQHPTLDIALLKIEEPCKGSFTYLEWSETEEKVGDWAFAFRGKGLFSDHLFVSPSVGKVMGHCSDAPEMMLLSIGAVSGNSGGPVLDLEGRVIGVITNGIGWGTVSGKETGITGAVSFALVKEWVQEEMQKDSLIH